MTDTSTEPKGVPYPFAGCEVMEAPLWVDTRRGRRRLDAWYVHSKSEPGVWYRLEYLQRFLTCSCKHGQIRFAAWLEANDEENPPTLERQRQLDKRLAEKCAHMRARDAYVAALDEANRVERPSYPVNIGLSDQ